MATPPSPESPQQPPPSPSAQRPSVCTDSDPDVPRQIHSPSSSASVDVLLPPDGQPRISRSPTVSGSNFVSSPLNPNAVVHSPGPPSLFPGSRAHSKQNMIFNRIASEESQALTSQRSSVVSNRASMILYRLAGEDEQRVLSPPGMNRQSVLSNSGDSVFTVSYDSKYPSGAHTPHKLIPYPFDPNLQVDTPEDDDALHDPSIDTPLPTSSVIPIRGFVNVGVLVLVLLALLFLFIFYPVWSYESHSALP